MASKNRLVTEVQAEKLAELYVWGAITEILEGSTAPRDQHGQKAAVRVLGIADKEKRRLIAMFDATPSLPPNT